MLDNYIKLENGVVKQNLISKTYVYDEDYIKNRYDSYKELSQFMGYLRLGYICGTLGKIPDSILDVGYGNGSFLTVCSNIIKSCYGYDISGYPIPKNCKKVDNITENYYEVISFFDSLEHFYDIDFISDLNCDFVTVSVPWWDYFSDEWFENWKHRRFDEHIWHFNLESLTKFMKQKGFVYVNSTNIEDVIRKPEYEYPNILTAIYKKMV